MSAFHVAAIHPLVQDAFNRGDVDGLANLYEINALLVIGGRRMEGREAIRQAYRDALAQGGQMKLETRSIIESPAGIAVLHGEWSIGPDRCGLSTEIVRKQPDGTWLFVIDTPQTPSLVAADANT
jgi:ketosteroid isomerase-like protein